MSIKILNPEKDYVLLPLTKGEGYAKAIIWPGMGAKHGTMNYIYMKAGAENVPHVHPTQEDMFYVVQGSGVVVDCDQNIEYQFKKGDFVYIPPGVTHTVISHGPEDYISVGGPCPVDKNVYPEELIADKKGQ